MGKGLAVITGASSGIGWEMSRQLAARGYDLLLVARRQERLRELATLIRSGSQAQADMLRIDLTLKEERRDLVSVLAREAGRLALVVNNAGFGALRPSVEIGATRSLEMIDVNIGALTELSLEAARILVARRAGGIINIASTAAFQPVPYLAVYSATKAYVLNLTEALAEELRDTGVRVMALCPGYTRTEFQQVSGESAESRSRRRMMSAEDCVRIGLRDFDAGKRVSITGIANQLQTFGSRMAPRSLVVHVAGDMMRQRMK